MNGIKEYNSLDEILIFIRDNFKDFVKKDDYNKNNVEFYLYKKPIARLNCNLFYYNAMIFDKKIL